MLCHLPHRVSVMTETRTSFIGGCYTTSWSSASIEWANCQMVAGTNESYEQNKKQQYTKWNVIMRYISTVTNKNRLSYGSKTLVIETVSDNVNRGRMMKLVCREEVV